MRRISGMMFLLLLLACVVFSGALLVASAANSPFQVHQLYCVPQTVDHACVLTYHNDNSRDGVNPNEADFNPSYFNSQNTPTGVALAPTDGLIYAQPLYIHQACWNGDANNGCTGGTNHNTVYVATENNSVYAFDASSGQLLGSVNLNSTVGLSSGSTEIALPYKNAPGQCASLVPEIGITGTPVIDVSVSPPAMFLVTTHEDIDSNNTKTYRQKLHVLRLDTLQDVQNVVLSSSTFTGYSFDPNLDRQRAGLALVDSGGTGNIWVAWGSHCDNGNYGSGSVWFSTGQQRRAI